MSLKSALDDLRGSHATLRQAAFELVMTVHEDRPLRSEVAVMDHVAEVVSEFQAAVVEAGDRLEAATRERLLTEELPAVDQAVATAAEHYWRQLRAYAPVAELRRAARGGTAEWRRWQGSLEQSLLRCEEPLDQTAASVRSAWREVGELLGLYLPPPAESRAPESAETVSTSHPARPITTRRSS
jgi:hypothetical protein